MKRFHLKVAVFAIVSIVLYVGMMLAFGYFDFDYSPNIKFSNKGRPGFLFSRLRELDTTRNVDLLFLGSSHAYRGFDTRIFQENGYRCFNLGSSLQTPQQTELLVNRYLNQLNPKIVVFEIFPICFQSEGLESALDLLPAMDIKKDEINYILRRHNPMSFNSLLYGMAYIKRHPIKKQKVKEESKGDIYVKGGFVQRKNADKKKDKVIDAPTHIEFTKENIEAFQRLMALLNARHIKVVLVQAPCSQEYVSKVLNREEINTFFQHFVGGNVSYISYNDPAYAAFQKQNLFFDDSHLSQEGVVMFNNHFITNVLKK